jgi:hypothetical protein
METLQTSYFPLGEPVKELTILPLKALVLDTIDIIPSAVVGQNLGWVHDK